MPSRPKGRIAYSRRKPAGVRQTHLPGGKKDGVPRAIVGRGERRGRRGGKGKSRSPQSSDRKGHRCTFGERGFGG